ncbi:hypothetical protein GGG16DRAFT_47743 [Schizophyllum commune]
MSTRNPFKRLAARATGDKLTPQATGTSTSTSDPFISPNPTGTTVSEAESLAVHGEGKQGQTQDPFHDQAAASSDTAGASASTAPNDVADAMNNLTIGTQPPALPPRRETMDDDSPPDTPQAPSPTASPPPHTPPRTPTQTQHSPPHQSFAPMSSSPPPLPPRQASTTNYAPPSSPPPGAARASPSTAGPSANARASSPPPPSFMSIDEDPPDYTPTPDYRHGEETLEYGPARPFQRPQHTAQGYHGWSPQAQRPQPSGAYLSPHPTGVFLSPQPTGSGRRPSPGGLLGQLASAVDRALENLATPPGSTYGPGYGQRPPQPPIPPISPMPPRPPMSPMGRPPMPPQPPRPPPAPGAPPPPPLHPQHTGLRPENTGLRPQPTGSAPPRPESDFARDFYAAGPVEVDGIPQSASTPHLSAFADSSPTATSPSSSHSRNASNPSASPSASSTNLRPTTTPTPGHPLLRDNRVLVYPAGVECPKCGNTGYKHGDPDQPCKRCWRKYGRAYEGALTYADFGPGGDGRMQRPLRAQQPPQQSQSLSGRRPTNAGPPGVAYHGRRPGSAGASYGRPQPASFGPSYSRAPGTELRVPANGPLLAHRPSWSAGTPSGAWGLPSGAWGSPQGVWGGGPPVRAGYGAAPPGSVVYAPGDPRIGGRPCWRCGGDGTVSSFFGLDEDTCGVCGGIGRTAPSASGHATMNWGSEDAAPGDAGEALCALYISRHPLDEPFFQPANLPIYIALGQYGMGPLVIRELAEERSLTVTEAEHRELTQRRNPAAVVPDPDLKITMYAVRELERRNALDARAIALFSLVWECVVVKRMAALQHGPLLDAQISCDPDKYAKARASSSNSNSNSPPALTPTGTPHPSASTPLPMPRCTDDDQKALYNRLLTDYRSFDVMSSDLHDVRCALPELEQAGVHKLVYGPHQLEDDEIEYQRPVLWFVHRCLHKVRMTMVQVAALGQYVKEEDVVAAATRTFVEAVR